MRTNLTSWPDKAISANNRKSLNPGRGVNFGIAVDIGQRRNARLLQGWREH